MTTWIPCTCCDARGWLPPSQRDGWPETCRICAGEGLVRLRDVVEAVEREYRGSRTRAQRRRRAWRAVWRVMGVRPVRPLTGLRVLRGVERFREWRILGIVDPA